MAFCDLTRILKLIFFGVLLSTVNLISTVLNIHYLFGQGNYNFAGLSVFLLWLPGIVSSSAFLTLYAQGNSTVLRMKTLRLIIYPLALLAFYPVIPIVLTLGHLLTGSEKLKHRADLSKLLAGFLDHGPHFVLRLVIVVLNGVAQNGIYQRGDVVFVLSMVTSFGSLVICALRFNERESPLPIRLFISVPMFSAIFGCRAFTLAVFLKEATDNKYSDSYLWLLILVIMFLTNLGLFRHCGQDWTRSLMFSMSSFLLPVGYNNDKEYYQLPHQNLVMDRAIYQVAPRLRHPEASASPDVEVKNLPQRQEELTEADDHQRPVSLSPMKSGQFLLGHILVNTVIMASCTAYIFATQDLSSESDDALVIPQILAVVPGLGFAVARSLLMPDICQIYDDNTTRPERLCGHCRKGGKICFAVIFTILGYFSLVPALFWTFIYKWFTSEDIKDAVLNELKD